VRPGASAIAAALALSACGYGFSQRYIAHGGADRIHVRPFENRSTEPDLGATLTSALRAELARRGSDAGEGAPAVLAGEVRASEPVVTSTSTVRQTGATPTSIAATSIAATWRIGIEVRARLIARDGAPVERVVRREIDFLAGGDPLETEGRRALALRRAADEVARDVLRALER
jgi:Lipopolysaccharide-assembly